MPFDRLHRAVIPATPFALPHRMDARDNSSSSFRGHLMMIIADLLDLAVDNFELALVRAPHRGATLAPLTCWTDDDWIFVIASHHAFDVLTISNASA
jgi:hypothetical protein